MTDEYPETEENQTIVTVAAEASATVGRGTATDDRIYEGENA